MRWRWPRYRFDFGARLFAKRVKTSNRPMTDAEQKAFDKVFSKMGETFDAMDDFFDVAFPTTVRPRRSRKSTKNHEGTKGSNHG